MIHQTKERRTEMNTICKISNTLRIMTSMSRQVYDDVIKEAIKINCYIQWSIINYHGNGNYIKKYQSKNNVPLKKNPVGSDNTYIKLESYQVIQNFLTGCDIKMNPQSFTQETPNIITINYQIIKFNSNFLKTDYIDHAFFFIMFTYLMIGDHSFLWAIFL